MVDFEKKLGLGQTPPMKNVTDLSFEQESISRSNFRITIASNIIYQRQKKRKKHLPTAGGLDRWDWKELGEETQEGDIFDWREAGNCKMTNCNCKSNDDIIDWRAAVQRQKYL